MPVTTSTSFTLFESTVRSSSSFLAAQNLNQYSYKFNLGNESLETLNSVSLLNATTDSILSFPLVNIQDTSSSNSINLDNRQNFNIFTFSLGDSEDILQDFSLPIKNNQLDTVIVELIQAYTVLDLNSQKLLDTTFVIGPSKEDFFILNLEEKGLLSDSGILNQIDDLGPVIINTLPVSGTVLNNPFQELKFRIQDNATTSISGNSINIYINSIPFVENGVVLQPNTFLSPVSLREYDFEYTNVSGFTLGSTVEVSGSVADVLGNFSNFNYSYRVWDELDLGVTISAAPDIEAPYIFSSNPSNLDVNVSQNTSLQFLLKDDHTGIDLNTLIVNINNENVISGVIVDNLYGTYQFNQSSDNRELEVTINPNLPLGFGNTITVDIQVDDLYTFSPNSFIGSYSFETEINSYLLVSGLHIFSDTNFIPFDITDVFNSKSPTEFFIDYLNTSGTGIDLATSKVIKNGTIIPSDFVPITGSDSHYRVFFELEPDYQTRSLLTFYIQAQGVDLPAGSQADLSAEIIGIETNQVFDLSAQIIPNILFLDLISSIIGTESVLNLKGQYTPRTEFIFKNFSKELYWGYEVCYSGEDLPYESLVQTNFKTQNQGCSTKKSSYVSSIYTESFPNLDLKAEIIAEGVNNLSLSGYIESINPFFEYGKTMNLVLETEDFAGNKLVFSWSFTIEDKN